MIVVPPQSCCAKDYAVVHLVSVIWFPVRPGFVFLSLHKFRAIEFSSPSIRFWVSLVLLPSVLSYHGFALALNIFHHRLNSAAQFWFPHLSGFIDGF
jgi:hypothetical protein